jgi:hypothetical protein
LGGVLYECLTGFAPPLKPSELWARSDSDSDSETGSGVQRALRTIPPDFLQLIEKAMAPLARDRFADARTLRDALLELDRRRSTEPKLA